MVVVCIFIHRIFVNVRQNYACVWAVACGCSHSTDSFLGIFNVTWSYFLHEDNDINADLAGSYGIACLLHHLKLYPYIVRVYIGCYVSGNYPV